MSDSQSVTFQATETPASPAQPAASDSYRLIETGLQTKLANGTTQCDLCLWRCKLKHGQRGFCQAHVNRHGTLYNLSYGILSAIELGPIEAKPVRYYQPGSQLLSIGSYGCNFRCGGCHNLEISWGVKALDDLARGESTAAHVTPQQIVELAQRNGAQGIAFTYSEPAVWLEYVIDVSKLAHDAGLYTVYVSNSFVTPESLERMAGHVDVLCSDIKSLNNDFYKDICPVATVDDVLKSINYAHKLGIHIENRTNVIPTKNDDLDELKRIAEWIRDNLGADSPWHITRFFPAYKLSHLPSTDPEFLEKAWQQAQAVGLTRCHVETDTGCDCATDNRPVSEWLDAHSETIHTVKKCAAECCGDEGVLLAKYEAS